MDHDHLPSTATPRTIRHELSLRSVFSIVAILAGVWLLVRIWPILLLVIVALVLAGTVSSLVSWLERHRVTRAVSLSLVLVALVAAVAGLGALIIPALVTQISGLITEAPAIQMRLAAYLASLPGLAGTATAVRDASAEGVLAPLGGYAVLIASATAQVVILSLTSVVLAFYLLADRERVKGFAFALLPRRFHLRAARILVDMETVVGGYVRGQALTSLLMGLFVYATLWVAGTPNAVAIAVFAALADLVPFVGAVLILVPAVLATVPLGLLPAALVAGAILVYLQVETNLVIPRIYGQSLRLSPFAVVVALLVGGQLLGIIGALLALPLAAGLRVLIEQLRIDLPGEQPGEATQRREDAAQEASYVAQTEGVSAVAAAEVATSMAAQEQQDELAETGRVAVPIEEQGACVGSAPAPQALR